MQFRILCFYGVINIHNMKEVECGAASFHFLRSIETIFYNNTAGWYVRINSLCLTHPIIFVHIFDILKFNFSWHWDFPRKFKMFIFVHFFGEWCCNAHQKHQLKHFTFRVYGANKFNRKMEFAILLFCHFAWNLKYSPLSKCQKFPCISK